MKYDGHFKNCHICDGLRRFATTCENPDIAYVVAEKQLQALRWIWNEAAVNRLVVGSSPTGGASLLQAPGAGLMDGLHAVFCEAIRTRRTTLGLRQADVADRPVQ